MNGSHSPQDEQGLLSTVCVCSVSEIETKKDHFFIVDERSDEEETSFGGVLKRIS